MKAHLSKAQILLRTDMAQHLSKNLTKQEKDAMPRHAVHASFMASKANTLRYQ